MRKRLISTSLIVLLLFVIYLLVNHYFLRNINCRGETYKYEIWSATPINFTDRIESGECECISSELFINSKIKLFSKQQLSEIRKTLPKWLDENKKYFSAEDKMRWISTIAKSDKELEENLKYSYSFIDMKTAAEVYVSTIQSNGVKIYCINYTNVYAAYDNPGDAYGFKLYPKKDKPHFLMIQNEDWIKKRFGDKGI